MSFFKFSKSYTSEFGYKIRIINIDRIFSTSDEDNTVSFIDGDSLVIDNNDYQELEEYLLYESESEAEETEESEEAEETEESETEETEETEEEEITPYNRNIRGLFRWII